MAEKTNGAADAQQTPSGAAANLPLFYKKPTPLDSKAHKDYGLKKNFGFGFTEGVNAVPINVIEMPQICHFYPIAFSPDESGTPVAILGLRDNENLFLTPDNGWADNAYIPAYIRRYPFIFSEIPDREELTLCVDLNEQAVQEGGEQKFFEENGKPTELSDNALEFCKSYHAAAQQTVEFSKEMVARELLIEREAQVNVIGNRRINFSGFKIINEEKLAELSDQEFIELRQKGWLPYIYAHLFSGAQWQRLSRLLSEILEKEEAA